MATGFDFDLPTPPRPREGPKNAGDLLKRLAPLLVALPAVWKGGGPMAGAAFLQAIQQAKAQRDQQGQEQYQMELQRAQLESIERSRREAAEAAQQRLSLQDQQRGDAFRERVMTAAQGLETPEGANALLSFLEPEAQRVGVPFDQVQAYVMETATPAKLLEKGIRKALTAAKPEVVQAWVESSGPLQVNGKTVPFEVWSQFVTGVSDRTGKPIVSAPPKPDVPNTPEEQFYQQFAIERGKTSFRELSTAGQAAARRAWSEAGRDPLQGPQGPQPGWQWVDRGGTAVYTNQPQPGDTPLSRGAGGGSRPVLSSSANRLSELTTSLDDVAVLRSTLFPDADLTTDVTTDATTGTRAKIGAMLPNVVTELTGWGESAKERQAVIDRVKQVIGKALEGGVLRKEDEYKYVKILPTIADPPAVARTKIDGLEAAIRLRYQRELESLEDAGYDTGRFRGRMDGTPTSPPPATNPFRRGQ